MSIFDDLSLEMKYNSEYLTKEHVRYGVYDLCYGVNDKPLVSKLSFDLNPGRHIIITGPSGSGKSTLLKVLKGLSQQTSGRIVLPSDVCFLPCNPYFLYEGNIRSQITYPDSSDLLSDIEYRQMISDCELEHIVNAFYMNQAATEFSDWTSRLSSGEKQRLAFCRILWRKPTFAFLDESTVHIGVDSAKRLFQLGMDRGITFIILTHENLVDIFPNNIQISLNQNPS